jgi:hypothetical protein
VDFDREADRLSDRHELGVATFGIVTFEPVANGRQLFAVGLSDVEYRHELEASDDPIVLAVLGVGVLVDHGGENPDGLLTLADEAIELPPGVEACHPSCLVALGGNEENVPKAVVVKAALEVEVALPFLGRREGTDPLCQLGDEFRVVVLGHHS